MCPCICSICTRMSRLVYIVDLKWAKELWFLRHWVENEFYLFIFGCFWLVLTWGFRLTCLRVLGISFPNCWNTKPMIASPWRRFWNTNGSCPILAPKWNPSKLNLWDQQWVFFFSGLTDSFSFFALDYNPARRRVADKEFKPVERGKKKKPVSACSVSSLSFSIIFPVFCLFFSSYVNFLFFFFSLQSSQSVFLPSQPASLFTLPASPWIELANGMSPLRPIGIVE